MADIPEPSNTKVAIGAVKTWLTTDGPIEFTKKMVMFLALAVMLGVGLGYFAMNAWSKRQELELKHAQLELLKKNAKESAENVVKSREQSKQIEAAIAKGEAHANRIKAEAQHQLNLQQESTREQLAPISNQLDEAGRSTLDRTCVDPRLSVGTVRLLNNARAGAGVDSPRGSDAESKAPSDVGLAALIANDLEIARLYHELAERHNALVDAVEKKLRDQAGLKSEQPTITRPSGPSAATLQAP